ncbi:Nucleoporin NDC1 [Cytospora mali]|uniref:Nucleoporin NDC1 n=1 Tax=Cytospora mali TaxID=578113 RepID=A0A194VTT2_CYTMA|nr:Nucleoporin NDC1 [Valsa mali]
MAPVRRAPYRDFLQPALQRRFSTTAAILLGIAFVEAVIFANWHSLFWAVFPIGPTGFRTFFLFLSGLAVLVLRIAQYHVGLRTSSSGLHTFIKYGPTIQTIESVITYTVSSWLFSQVYLWSASAEDLAWVSFQFGDRARLNERPIFFTVHFLVFGLAQGLFHIFRDDDRLRLGCVALDDKDSAANENQPTLSARLMDEIPALVSSTLLRVAVILGGYIFLYHAVLRGVAWRTTLALFRPFYTLPRTNMVPVSLGGMNMVLWVRIFYTSSMLMFLWLAGNKMFSLFLVRAPLKNGNPLTSESKDPNGSLLNGLKSKKLPIQCFAMWEAALIARDFQPRRIAIYQDIDRRDGPMWSQVCALCLDVVKGMEIRIDSYGKAPEPAPAAPVPAVTDARPALAPAKSVSNENVLLSTPAKKSLRSGVGRVVRKEPGSPGQASRLSPMVGKGVSQARGYVEAIARQATGAESPSNPFQYWTRRILGSPLGYPFKQTFDRRLTTAVLGTPYGELSLFINAISTLTMLAVFSLTEDSYGNVHRDVATILRTFTAVTTKLEGLQAEFPLHWTDIDGKRECEDVDAIVKTLKEGLQKLIHTFGPFARDLRLSFADMRLAREAAGLSGRERDVARIEATRPEMRQLR